MSSIEFDLLTLEVVPLQPNGNRPGNACSVSSQQRLERVADMGPGGLGAQSRQPSHTGQERFPLQWFGPVVHCAQVESLGLECILVQAALTGAYRDSCVEPALRAFFRCPNSSTSTK
jgi:hypothetical protein